MPDGRESRGVGPHGMPSVGANVGATRANDFARQADRRLAIIPARGPIRIVLNA